MFPKYQKLDEENKAKRRVIKSLAKKFLNETVSVDVGSNESASQLYDKLEGKLNVLNALTFESLHYFASDFDEESGVTGRVGVFGLIPVLGRLLISARESNVIAKQLVKVFNYLENDQANDILELLTLTMNTLTMNEVAF
jgi:hypothetical protein